MAIKAGVGTSHHHNSNVAGREATEQALANAGVVKPDFVFMFASVGYDSPMSDTIGAPCCGRCEWRLEVRPSPDARQRAR